MNVERVRDAYASVADLYIGLFGSAEKVPADDLDLIDLTEAERQSRSAEGTQRPHAAIAAVLGDPTPAN